MRTVSVRNVTIGSGKPVICMPVMGKSVDEVLLQADEVKKTASSLDAYVVEWRIDCFDNVTDANAVKDTASALRALFGEVPLLFTFRSANEGGERDISPEKYADILKCIITDGIADMIDTELFMPEDIVKGILSSAGKKGVKVIMSNHDFAKTPLEAEIISRLRTMEEYGCDICKIAVMPQSTDDVISLLKATNEFSKTSNVPLITMSMGGKGLISRLCGEVFGSALTFGCAGRASAPGQISADKLNTVLDIIHENLGTTE
jgi:3-dehydroquinate dehydratase-1